MRILRIALRVCGWLGALLLTLLTLAVSAVNMASVTPYWVMVVLDGAGLSLFIALLVGVLTRLVRKTVAWKAVKVLALIACVFLAQMPLHFLCNAASSFAVRSCVEQQLPQLDAYQKQHGQYPGTLDDIVAGGKVGSFLLGQWSSYSVYNERSSYRMSVQRPMASGQYVYDSARRRWK